MEEKAAQTGQRIIRIKEIRPLPSKYQGREVALIAEMDEKTLLLTTYTESRIYNYLMTGIRRNKDFQLTIDFRMGDGATVKCTSRDGTLYGECHIKQEGIRAVAEFQSKIANFILAHARIGQNPRLVLAYKSGILKTNMKLTYGKLSILEEP